jgi:hypothetical protein
VLVSRDWRPKVRIESCCLFTRLFRFTNENIELLPHLHEQGLNNAGLLAGSDELGHESRQSTYIKEESPDIYHNPGACETIYLPSFEHDDGDLCRMHSPISLQNDLVASVLSSEEVCQFIKFS